jgi:lipopolysaccharide transport system ATP-binding protein
MTSDVANRRARVELNGVSKRFVWSGRSRRLANLGRRGDKRELWALRDVDLRVTDGQAVGVVGTNGSGKSTLLRLIAGLSRPTRGRMAVEGSVRGLLKLGESLNPLLTAEENARTDLMLSGVSRRDADRMLGSVAEFAELEDHLDQPLRTYSQGMRLRLAFATAVAVVPDLLLIDELLAVGDGHFQEKCMRRVADLHGDGTTVIVTSHEVGQVTRLCDRAIWLVQGELREDGDPGVVADHYQGVLREADLGVDPGREAADGEGLIRTVTLVQPGGVPTGAINSGGPLGVVIDYALGRQLPDAVLEVAVHPEGSPDPVVSVNTSSDEVALALGPGAHQLTLELERTDLVGGRYHVDVGLFSADWKTTYAFEWEAAALEVRGEPGDGLMAPPRRWRADRIDGVRNP